MQFLQLDRLKMDWKIAGVIVISTLVLVIEHYNRIFGHTKWDRLFLYLGVPMVIILLIFRDSPKKYGFQFGDWKAGLILTLIGCVGMTIVMAFVSRTESFQRYYERQNVDTLQLIIDNAIDLFGWEFLFRGFLLFALYPVCGPYAIILQAVPFTIAHWGKPQLETLSCIFGGSAFGYVAWRSRSFVYAFLIHWFLMTITVLFASGFLG